MANRCLLYAVCTLGCMGSQSAAVADVAQDGASDKRARCIIVDLYVSGNSKSSNAARERVGKYIAKNPGYMLRVFDISTDKQRRDHLTKICHYYQIENATPRAYGAATLIGDCVDESRLARDLQALATLTVYVRSGCPRCKSAEEFLPEFVRQYLAVRIKYRDIAADPSANQELQSLVSRHRTAAASVPVFHICNKLLVGFTDTRTTGDRLRAVLKPWTAPCPRPLQWDRSSNTGDAAKHLPQAIAFFPTAVAGFLTNDGNDVSEPPGLADLPLPGSETDESVEPPSQDEIDLPVVGRLKVKSVGFPVFTLVVGLVDGFNPCAMWVLLFLLSVLVNLHSRWKILAVAGTFVVISAAAYFAFMAAWFSVFRFVGVLREVQIVIACIAICIGLVHVKDFFAFKRGITLSIPEAAKPGIYERVRRIVTAENLVGAIVATVILAVLVNIVELLCTAGLPAVYTQILNAQQLPQWQNYAYLLLYDVGYMFDDALMVTIVVVTMERHKLQETQGRWLKLLSGTAIMVLGIIMLIRPQWLGM